jgi:hypothetical protein
MPTHNFAPISLTAIVLSLVLPLPISAQSAQVEADTSKPLIEIRFARRTPASDFRRIPDPPPSHVAFPNNSLYISNKNVFSDSDFADVRAVLGPPNGLILNVRWKPDAAERFAQILRGQFEAGIDQLAVFLDGEFITSSVILVTADARVPTSVPISLPMVASERATQIEAAVAKRWPRRGY